MLCTSQAQKFGKLIWPDYVKFILFDAVSYDLVREDRLSLSDHPKAMSDLAERLGLLHMVDSPEPSIESKTQRELHSICVFLHQRIVLDSYTSSCSLVPCFGLFMMICPYSAQQRRHVVLWQLSLALLFLGLCPYSPTSSYAVSERMFARALTSFSFCLRTVKVLFGPSHRHLGDI